MAACNSTMVALPNECADLLFPRSSLLLLHWILSRRCVSGRFASADYRAIDHIEQSALGGGDDYLFLQFLPANHIIQYHGKQDAHNKAVLHQGAHKVWDAAED